VKRIPPALVLFFLAPAIGELLSGSSPPVEFFQPFTLLLLGALYGSGAILSRELTLRWEKRWPTIFLLGAAYGIVEEGLMVKSFFDPAWPDLGLLGVYGRWAGINWVWSVFLTLYHAVFSIAIPIFLVEQCIPERGDEPWVGKRGLRGLAILLAFDVIFGFTLLTSYRPPPIPYIMAGAAAAALVWMARRAPVEWRGGEGTPSRPLSLVALGFLAVTVFFLMNWALPELGVPVGITLVLEGGWAVLMFTLVRRASGYGEWTDRGRLALVSGALTFLVLLAPISELDATRSDNTTGMAVVGLVTLAFLFWLHRKVQIRISGGTGLLPEVN
jgi:hypothetical protein